MKAITNGIVIIIVISMALFVIAWIRLPYIQPADLMAVDNSEDIVIDRVNIVTMNKNEPVTYAKQIRIKDGIISEIVPAGTPIPYQAKVIDANNRFVTPGLIDMHVHLADRKNLVLSLAHGVTTVRALRGDSKTRRWKSELKQNQWLGSRLILSSAILDGENAHALNEKVTTVEQAKKAVEQAVEEQADLIKVYGYVSAEVFLAIKEAAKEVGLPLVKHGPHPITGLEWSSLQGLQSLEHVEDIFQGPLKFSFDENALAEIASEIKALNVPVTPTLATFEHLTRISSEKEQFLQQIDLDFINPVQQDLENHYTISRWLADNKEQSAFHQRELTFLKKIVKVLDEHHVTLLAGSDGGTMYSVPGSATLDEIRLLSESGLSNETILKSATINAAIALKLENQIGLVNEGLYADLLILDENPLRKLNTLQEPFAIVKNGQWLGRQELYSLRESAKNNMSYFWSALELLEDIRFRQL